MFAPNTIKEKLLAMGYAQAAMLLDAIFASDVNQWPSFDVQTLLGWFLWQKLPIGHTVVRRGLKDLAKLKLIKTKLIMNRRKGRPMIEYSLMTSLGMANHLGVKLHHAENHDPVPFEAFKAVTKYRGALHRALFVRLEGAYTREFLGKRLGVSGRTTFNYEQGTDIEVQQKLELERLYKGDIAHAPEKKIVGRFFLRVRKIVEMTEDEINEKYKETAPENRHFWKRTKTIWVSMPYTRHILERELRLGNECYKAWQVANYYSIAA